MELSSWTWIPLITEAWAHILGGVGGEGGVSYYEVNISPMDSSKDLLRRPPALASPDTHSANPVASTGTQRARPRAKGNGKAATDQDLCATIAVKTPTATHLKLAMRLFKLGTFVSLDPKVTERALDPS